MRSLGLGWWKRGVSERVGAGVERKMRMGITMKSIHEKSLAWSC